MRLQSFAKCAAVAGALALPFTLGAPAASATSGGAARPSRSPPPARSPSRRPRR
ncbi:hypothetical protein [Actinomadura madurae]|uniref:hypothetical protein n=1 Tax=Actinomadura madurae TaxID=1993 RepID=UPI0020D22C45|nr:hypothetical protein [Actinomadura madurae]MCQ0017907.1 hypothetical protein [Actinomadura madurae]